MVEHPPAEQEIRVESLGGEDPLEKWMATHYSIFAWRIPRTEKPGRLQSMGSQRVRQDWETNTFTWVNTIYSVYKSYIVHSMHEDKLRILHHYIEHFYRLTSWRWFKSKQEGALHSRGRCGVGGGSGEERWNFEGAEKRGGTLKRKEARRSRWSWSLNVRGWRLRLYLKVKIN